MWTFGGQARDTTPTHWEGVGLGGARGRGRRGLGRDPQKVWGQRSENTGCGEGEEGEGTRSAPKEGSEWTPGEGRVARPPRTRGLGWGKGDPVDVRCGGVRRAGEGGAALEDGNSFG